MFKELRRLANRYKYLTKGTNTISFLTLQETKKIPRNKTITYARITVDYQPQKKDPFRV